jgi:hypothetical protein
MQRPSALRAAKTYLRKSVFIRGSSFCAFCALFAAIKVFHLHAFPTLAPENHGPLYTDVDFNPLLVLCHQHGACSGPKRRRRPRENVFSAELRGLSLRHLRTGKHDHREARAESSRCFWETRRGWPKFQLHEIAKGIRVHVGCVRLRPFPDEPNCHGTGPRLLQLKRRRFRLSETNATRVIGVMLHLASNII